MIEVGCFLIGISLGIVYCHVPRLLLGSRDRELRERKASIAEGAWWLKVARGEKDEK